MRFGALSGWVTSVGGVAASTLLLTTPSSAYLTGTRAEIDGRTGSTLGGHYIAIPESVGSSVGDHYFYFTQDDGDGVQRGFDPIGWESGLTGYTGHQVSLPFGNLSSSQVSTVLSSSMSSTYSSIFISGSELAIQSEIDVTGTFFGNSWDERGPAGIWGFRDGTALGSEFSQANTILAHMLTPDTSGSILIRGMSIYIGGTYDGTDQLRLVCYQGGTGSLNPVGATLLYDFGQIESSGTDRWHTLWATGSVEMTSGSDTWIGCISAGTSATTVGYENSSQDFGDFTESQDIRQFDTPLGNSPGSAAPTTIGTGSVLTAFGFVIGCKLHYETTPIVGNGEWKRKYGVHVAPAAVPTDFAFSGTQFVGGNLPIQVSSSVVDYIEVIGESTPTYRLALMQGGAIEAPASSTIVWDGGQLAGGAGSDWYRVTAPTGSSSVPIDIGEPIWVWIKGDGSNGRLSIDTGAPNQVNPDDNPMDWPQNLGVGSRQEYNTLDSNPNHTLDATVAFESPFVSDITDVQNGNNPPYGFGMRVDGFTAVLSGS